MTQISAGGGGGRPGVSPPRPSRPAVIVSIDFDGKVQVPQIRIASTHLFLSLNRSADGDDDCRDDADYDDPNEDLDNR